MVEGSDQSWAVGMLNGMFCMTSFLVLHTTICAFVYIELHVGQLIYSSVAIPIMGICQMLLLPFRFDICGALVKKKVFLCCLICPNS